MEALSCDGRIFGAVAWERFHNAKSNGTLTPRSIA
jgi:hypothetical protein